MKWVKAMVLPPTYGPNYSAGLICHKKWREEKGYEITLDAVVEEGLEAKYDISKRMNKSNGLQLITSTVNKLKNKVTIRESKLQGEVKENVMVMHLLHYSRQAEEGPNWSREKIKGITGNETIEESVKRWNKRKTSKKRNRNMEKNKKTRLIRRKMMKK